MVNQFPWEAVLQYLGDSPHTLLISQMTCRTFRGLLIDNHAFWRKYYYTHLHKVSHARSKVKSVKYAELSLYKEDVWGVPVHMGLVHGDAKFDPSKFQEATFTSFVRKSFALTMGRRCGLCGCRYRHVPVWSLGMRVCRLCVSDNVISCWDLFDKYGLSYSKIFSMLKGSVFYFQTNATTSNQFLRFHGVRKCDYMKHRSMWMFWVPHLQKHLNLPALYAAQIERKKSASLLCAVVARAWVTSQRILYAKHSKISIDWMVNDMYQNEANRKASSYGCLRFMMDPGGPNSLSSTGRRVMVPTRNSNNDQVARFYMDMHLYADFPVAE
jgi:hypothetical protein